jgi:hypothetical protein
VRHSAAFLARVVPVRLNKGLTRALHPVLIQLRELDTYEACTLSANQRQSLQIANSSASPQDPLFAHRYPARMTPRTDDQAAAMIYLALFLRHLVDPKYAADLLARHSVPNVTVERVLTTLRRRGW